MTNNTSGDSLIFFGTDAFSVPSLIRLLAEDWPITAVVTKPDSPTGRGRQITPPAVKRLAEAKKIPVLQPNRLSDCIPQIDRLRPTAGIVVAYGKIIPESVISLFPKGLINVHASLLPRWRGASPIEHTILSGDTDTGVTLMSIEPGLDTGPTYTSAKIQLGGTETRLDLYEQLAEMGADLLSSDLGAILSGTIAPIPQDSEGVTSTKLIVKADGDIDWTNPAVRLEREVRAYLGWPGSRTTIAGTPVTITAARTLAASGGPAGTAYVTPSRELAVYTGDGSLVVDTLKPAGKAEMTGQAFLTGHPLS
jgi:methionyl-tRNA formyltransferase